MNLDELQKKLDLHGDLKTVSIYSNGHVLCMEFHADSYENMKMKLIAYLEMETPQAFKLDFKVNKNSKEKYTHRISTLDPTDNTVVQGAQVAPQMTPDAIDKIVQGKVEELYGRRKFEDEKKEFYEEKKKFDTLGGKLTFYIDALAKQYLIPPQKALTVQGTPPVNPEGTVQTDRDQNLDRESLEIFLTCVDSITLNNFAKKIKADPSVVNLLKNYL